MITHFKRKKEVFGFFIGEKCGLRPATSIKNLFLTGQDIVCVGIGGALMVGVLTASVMLQKNILKDLKKAGHF